jgi:hypothetical protein
MCIQTFHEKYDAPCTNLASNLCDPQFVLALIAKIKPKSNTQVKKKKPLKTKKTDYFLVIST